MLTKEQTDFYLNRCHAKQRAFLSDPRKYKALLCPRGTGKTTAMMFAVLLAALKHPRSTIAYVVPDSKAHAKDLFWLPLRELNSKLNLGLKFNEVEKRVTHPNGTNILLLAAHDKDSPARLRGVPFSLVALDECKDFGAHFETLIVEAVVPRLGDFDGSLILGGTPGQILEGLFYDITGPGLPGWGVHIWIKSDNTFLPEEERDLTLVWERRYKPFGIGMDDPKFEREQKAIWVADATTRAYKYHPSRNDWDNVLNPHIEYEYIVGIDLGKRDATVFSIGGFSTYDPNLYCIEQTKHHPLNLSEIADEYIRLNRLYNFVSVVVDTGGLGVMIVDDLNDRYGFNWKAAEKKQKASYVEQMNADFLTGRIKCNERNPLAKAWLRLTKDVKTGLPMHSDDCDAALYMWRESLHWTGAYQTPPPQPGTKEFLDDRNRQEIQKALDRRKKDREGFAYSDQNI